MKPQHLPTPGDIALVTAICFGWPILISTGSLLENFTGQEFSDSGFLWLIFVEIAFGGVALLLLRQRNYDLATLYPAPSIPGMLRGAALFLAAGFVSGMAGSLATHFAARNPVGEMMARAHPTLAVVVVIAIVNGTYEEIFLLGFLQRALQRHGFAIAVGAPLLVRILYHTYQGPVGLTALFGYGLVAGSYFFWRSGSVFPLVFAHILSDIVPFSQ